MTVTWHFIHESDTWFSGPQRYDFDEKHHKWFYHRDNHTLDQVLSTELSKAIGQDIDLLEGFEPEEK